VLTPDTSHLDYAALIRASRTCDDTACARTMRVALLSDAAVPQLVPLLKVLLARKGVKLEVYQGEYDAVELDVFNEDSGLYAFTPDAVVILSSINALRLKYYRQQTDRQQFGDEAAAKCEALWDTIRQHSAAVIIQSNYVLPYERQFGNFDHKVPEAFYPTVMALNASIAAKARSRPSVLINDVEALASYVGRKQWCDERLWTLAKAFCAFEYLPLVAQNIVDILLSNAGHVVKCVVTDLDNTLWGGVIGDDGPEGIVISPSGDGEPFQRLQHYLLELKKRGIVLAVCSKNDEATALEPFRSHPEMVLREDDIAVFVANWNPKPDNIRTIKEALNIGYDSMVFLDDNIFERQLVRECLPEVIVPELPEDASDYVRAIAELNLFEVTAFSDEDTRRAELYRQNVQRQQVAMSVSDISEYLRSIEMTITMKRFDAFHLPRIAQLIQRSNQFNLTTRRYHLAQCEAMMNSEDTCLPLYLKLSDKFGDHGLISVVILQLQPAELVIDTWLMSCRVLGRGVEQYAMNEVVAVAKARGYASILGTYIPTAKNAMVKDFYERLGFEKVQEPENGEARWRLSVALYDPRIVHMEAAD
jgi:FkbH-like protein